MIKHNTVVSNYGGDGVGIHVELYEPSTVVISNTIIVGQTAGVTVTSGDIAIMEGTLWGNDAWGANDRDWGGDGTIITGTINLREDPGFADPLADDYHLAGGSAAINGIDAGVATDIDGAPRPVGPRPDIGADEYRFGTYVYLPLMLRAWSSVPSASVGRSLRYLPWRGFE